MEKLSIISKHYKCTTLVNENCLIKLKRLASFFFFFAYQLLCLKTTTSRLYQPPLWEETFPSLQINSQREKVLKGSKLGSCFSVVLNRRNFKYVSGVTIFAFGHKFLLDGKFSGTQQSNVFQRSSNVSKGFLHALEACFVNLELPICSDVFGRLEEAQGAVSGFCLLRNCMLATLIAPVKSSKNEANELHDHRKPNIRKYSPSKTIFKCDFEAHVLTW